MSDRGFKVQTHLVAGVDANASSINSGEYIDCYKTCYPDVVQDPNVTFNQCMADCIGEETGTIQLSSSAIFGQ